jgi:hypothetical protein
VAPQELPEPTMPDIAGISAGMGELLVKSMMESFVQKLDQMPDWAFELFCVTVAK